MTSFAASSICFCLSCCCKDCAQGCERWLGIQRVTKIAYFVLVAVFTIPTILLFFCLGKIKIFTDFLNNLISCPNKYQGGLGCIGHSIVFRLSLALLILFSLLFIVMLFRSRLSMIFNQGCFSFKYLIVLGIIIGFLWVDNHLFYNFSEASKYISVIFMILQSIILIDLFYLFGIKMIQNYSEGKPHYALYLIVLTFIFQFIAIGLNILGYLYFRGKSAQCDSTLWVNVLTSLLLIILPIIQLLQFNLQNSLLTTSLISMFISYLTFIAQFSFGDSVCVRANLQSLGTDIVCSTFFFILTIYGSIMGGTGQIKWSEKGDINKAMGLTSHPIRASKSYQENTNEPASIGKPFKTEEQNLTKYTESWQWAKWHFYMCIASIYVSMLLTNWASVDLTTGRISSSMSGFWVRLAIAWLSFILYVWTMVAPRVCPGRDFYFS